MECWCLFAWSNTAESFKHSNKTIFMFFNVFLLNLSAINIRCLFYPTGTFTIFIQNRNLFKINKIYKYNYKTYNNKLNRLKQ